VGRKKIVTIVGTRPQFIKAAALDLDDILVHTGQHYDYGLSKQIWDGLKLREPDHLLGCGHDKPYHQFECLIRDLTLVLKGRKPDFVIVIGDCNSTLAGALAASLLKIPVIHIEAGLRCFDIDMPEERNRKLTDHLALVNFCIDHKSKWQLVIERSLGKAHVVGDLLYDSFLSCLDRLKPIAGDYYLATVHREENAVNHIDEILDGLDALGKRVIFPKHPRIKVNRDYENIEIIEPVDYLSMLNLQLGADMVFTDSGGVQREAVWLGKPCVLLRDKTELTQFVLYGHVLLAGHSKKSITESEFAEWPDIPFDHGQDGQAGKRIAEIIYGL
jgi:UDP-GlcNAc3NAcA epimerase